MLKQTVSRRFESQVPPWLTNSSAFPVAQNYEHRPHDGDERSGTYFREMSWSTSRRTVRYETFSWSSQNAADRRRRRSSTASDRKLKETKTSLLHEKKDTSASTSKLSKRPGKDSRASKRRHSGAPSVASVAAKSTAALLKLPAESPKLSPLSGRRLPGKAKAESKLLHEKHPAKPLPTRNVKLRQSSEVASQMLHSDTTISSINGDVPAKTASRKPSIAANRRASKTSGRGEAGSPSPGLRNISHEEISAVAVAKEKRTSTAGVTEECQAQAQHHGILKASHKTDAFDERRQSIQEVGEAKSENPISEDTYKPRSGAFEAEAGEKLPREAAYTKAASEEAQTPAKDAALIPESRRGSVLSSISGICGTKGSTASSHEGSIGLDTTGFTEPEKTIHGTTASKEHDDAEIQASGNAEDNNEDRLDDVFSSAQGTPKGAKSPSREAIPGAVPIGTSSVATTAGAVPTKHESGSSEKSLKSSASNRSEKTAPAEKNGSSEEPSSGQEKPLGEQHSHEAEPKVQPLPLAAEADQEADTESKQDMDEILRELENQTTVIYPESNLVVVLAIVCIVWICVIVLLSRGSGPGWQSGSSTLTPPIPSTDITPSVVPPTRSYECSTDSCIKDGEYFAGLLNHDVSPCDNFYQYVCSHWENLMQNPAAGIGVATSIDTMMEDIMHTNVLEYILDSTHNDVVEAKRLYQACMTKHGDESTIELRQLFATWPPAQRWPVESEVTVTVFDVWSAAARLMREFGLAALVGVQAAIDKTYGQSVIELQLPRLLFFRGDDQHSAIVSLFQAAISESAQLFNTSGMLYELTSDVMAVFKSIAKRKPHFPGLEVKLVPLENLDQGLQTFVNVLFEGTLTRNTTVQYSNPVYFDHELTELFNELEPRSLLNFLGFRLIVSVAPFLPDSMNLMKLYSVQATGRVLSPTPKWVLCLRAVESVLPVCVVKAHAKLTLATGTDLTSRAWMSQLESMFFRSIRRYSWMDSRTRHVVHFMLRRLRLARFYPPWSLKVDQCAGGALPPGSSPFHLFYEASKVSQSQRRAQLTRRARPREVGDAFGTLARFSPGHQAVYVPFGIVNASVPGNGTAFAFQLARMAVRLYFGLVPALLDDGTADESSTQLRYTDRAQRLLDELLDCLARDFRIVSGSMRHDADVDPDEARYALLAHTAAVALTHAAFK
ncbi:hypothetical protein V5799_019299, partial [Amblyomma americanum]